VADRPRRIVLVSPVLLSGPIAAVGWGLVLSQTRAAGPVCTVDDYGGTDYTTIGAAIADPRCTTVNVADGTYVEDIALLSNTVSVAGGAPHAYGTAVLENVTLSGNPCGLTAAGDITNTDPLLGPLRDNGSSMAGLEQANLTHALLKGSPAIDQGDDGVCPATDQHGFSRPIDGDGAMSPPVTLALASMAYMPICRLPCATISDRAVRQRTL